MADTLQPAALQLYAAEVGKAIAKTEANIAELRRQRDQLQGTRDLVAELPKRLTHDVMVPFGRHAFFPGHLRQTNELLVELGAQYHVQCTAHHAEQVLQRRVQRVADGIRACEQQLQNHRARLQLSSEALGSSDATDEMEIRQSYDESEALLASVHAQPKKQARSQATTPLSQPGTSTSPDPDLDRLFAHMDKLALLEAADEADEAEASAADSSQEPSPAAAVSSAPGLTPALGTDPLSYSLADSDDDDDTMPAQQPRHGWLQPEGEVADEAGAGEGEPEGGGGKAMGGGGEDLAALLAAFAPVPMAPSKTRSSSSSSSQADSSSQASSTGVSKPPLMTATPPPDQGRSLSAAGHTQPAAAAAAAAAAGPQRGAAPLKRGFLLGHAGQTPSTAAAAKRAPASSLSAPPSAPASTATAATNLGLDQVTQPSSRPSLQAPHPPRDASWKTQQIVPGQGQVAPGQGAEAARGVAAAGQAHRTARSAESFTGQVFERRGSLLHGPAAPRTLPVTSHAEAAGGDVTQLAGHAAGPRPVAAAIDEGQQVGGSPAAHQEQLQGPSQPRQAMGQGQPTEPDLATRMQPMAAGRSAPGGGSGRQISKFKQQQLAARGAL